MTPLQFTELTMASTSGARLNMSSFLKLIIFPDPLLSDVLLWEPQRHRKLARATAGLHPDRYGPHSVRREGGRGDRRAAVAVAAAVAAPSCSLWGSARRKVDRVTAVGLGAEGGGRSADAGQRTGKIVLL